MCRYFNVMGIFFLHNEIWETNLVSEPGLCCLRHLPPAIASSIRPWTLHSALPPLVPEVDELRDLCQA
jgi:hypothetical protein